MISLVLQLLEYRGSNGEAKLSKNTRKFSTDDLPVACKQPFSGQMQVNPLSLSADTHDYPQLMLLNALNQSLRHAEPRKMAMVEEFSAEACDALPLLPADFSVC